MKTTLFQLGDFTLAGGKKSKWKLECDALADADVECLAYLIRRLVGRFGSVEGVPRGGLRLAKELEQYRNVDMDGFRIVGSILPLPHLIVDDVLTTGASLARAREAFLKSTSYAFPNDVKCAVVFARGKCPPWVKAVFPMPEGLWP